MNKDQAKLSIKNLINEIVSLNPSAVITLFEIDITDIAFGKGLISSPSNSNEEERIFRFHNSVSDIYSNIIWQNKSYYAAPIKAEGFEITSKGSLPVPRLSITTNEEGVPYLSQLKSQILRVGDLSGAKVTRIRTLYKYLDSLNFINNQNPTADPNAEFPRDIYYVDRKSSENKNFIEYELASILDVETVKLPSRLVLSNRCPFQYRGEGCLYEAASNRVNSIHGYSNKSRMPTAAPPVATENGELIKNLLPTTTSLVAAGKWSPNTVYTVGQYVYIEKNNLKYYFVAKTTVPINTFPPNGIYWIADACSKQIDNGCKYRWGIDSNGVQAPGRLNGNPHNGCLPFGGFPGVDRNG